MGFTHRLTTPESAQANGFAEIFVKTLVKLIHTAVANKTEPKRAVQLYLMAYRVMPHTVTGRSPAELLFNRSIQTKLPPGVYILANALIIILEINKAFQ